MSHPAYGPPGSGAEVKLPPFEARRGAHGRKTMERHLRAADGGRTPTEAYRRNEAIKKNMGMEGVAWNTEGYRSSEIWCPGCDGRHARMSAQPLCRWCMGLEQPRAGRVRTVYPEFAGEVKR